MRSFSELAALDERVCVDDGSTDGTAGLLQREFRSAVRILRVPENRGKARAVLYAAQQMTSDYILLVDADLQGVRVGEFEQALQAVKENPTIDMVVLRRIRKDPLTRILRGDVLITGERILRRVDLLQVLQDQAAQGYELELAINQYMLRREKIVRWAPVSSLSVPALQKLGWRAGLVKEARMFAALFRFLGLRNLVHQMMFFGRVRL